MVISKHSNQQCFIFSPYRFSFRMFLWGGLKDWEMVPLLTALTALAEELGSVSSTPMELELQVVNHHALFWTLRPTLCTHKDRVTHKRHNEINIIFNLFFTHSLEISYM